MRTLLAKWIAVVMIVSLGGVNALGGVTAQTAESTPQPVEIPQFSIAPIGTYENPWFEVTITPGDTVELVASIGNFGSDLVSLRTYVANAFNPPNGGFSAGTEDQEPTGVTRWISYPSETFELQPGERREYIFTVSVPADTPPGEYVAGLVVQTADSVAIPGTETFRQIIRSTVSVEIVVPGEMSSGVELGDPEVSSAENQWILDIPVTNTGTARVRPQGKIVVTTPDGDEVVTSPVEMGSVYGGNTTVIRISLPGQLSPGDYVVSVELVDEATGVMASIENAPIVLANAAEATTFVVEDVSITPNASPIQFANVTATIVNNGQTIPTANVVLNVQRDGDEVESYPLAQNQALPQGSTDFTQRYIPIDGWQPGTYTFEFVISAVSGGTETDLATIEVENEIVVP